MKGINSEINQDIIPGSFLGNGRYRIIRRIGSGSFGEIFQVEDRKTPGRLLAAKLEKVAYDPDKRSKLRQEYDIMK